MNEEKRRFVDEELIDHFPKNKSKILLWILGILILIFIFFMGYFLRGWVDNVEREKDGLWFMNQTYEEIWEITQSADSRGNWICVNTNGMTLKEAIKTCNHEVGHKIFARVCEDNIEKCLGVE